MARGLPHAGCKDNGRVYKVYTSATEWILRCDGCLDRITDRSEMVHVSPFKPQPIERARLDQREFV